MTMNPTAPQPATQWKPMSQTPDRWPVWVFHPEKWVYPYPLHNLTASYSYRETGYTQWTYAEIPAPPPLPKPDAFRLWLRSLPDNILASELTDRCRREGWDAGEAHGRNEERARFASGVETLFLRYSNDEDYTLHHFEDDLRALAKGAA